MKYYSAHCLTQVILKVSNSYFLQLNASSIQLGVPNRSNYFWNISSLLIVKTHGADELSSQSEVSNPLLYPSAKAGCALDTISVD